MVKQLGPNTAEVKFSELGTKCWIPCRFIQENGRCCRVWTCKYPEKKTCQAVEAEIRHLKDAQIRLLNLYVNIDNNIDVLKKQM